MNWQSEINAQQAQTLSDKARIDLLLRSKKIKDTIHWGGSLSLLEIVSVLFLDIMTNDDKFFLSKGHGAPGVYAIMHQLGKLSNQDWASYREDGSPITELMEYNPKIGFNVSGGSLGLAPSYASGMALLWKKMKKEGHIYILVGDGELNEGSVWEALIAAAHFQLDNITVLVDANKYQSDGKTECIMKIPELKRSFEDLGWIAYEVDGHDCSQLIEVLKKRKVEGKPTVIICNTVKGNGISFMENAPEWHDRAMTPDEYIQAWNEVCKNVAT